MTCANPNTKVCTKCKVDKQLSNFHKNNTGKDGMQSFCKDCQNKAAEIYRKTKKGAIAKIYSNQRESSKRRNHPMPDYTLSQFREWAFSIPEFHDLYDKWVSSSYDSMKAPSADRLDDDKPYSLNRLRWITWSENKLKGYSDIKCGVNSNQLKAVIQMNLDGEFIKEHYSQSQAARDTGVSNKKISDCCKGTRNHTAGGFRWSFVA